MIKNERMFNDENSPTGYNDDPLTKEEKLDLADRMINLWASYFIKVKRDSK